ncbi:MAG: FN3 associated domain-containing protein [Bacteroidota bacterium]|nr:FN3 associated domain-containing protein [Bacteroidota bacterium]
MATLSGVPGPYQIHYTLDGSKPVSSSSLYSRPFSIRKSCTLTAAVLVDHQIIDLEKKSLVLHKAVGQQISLQTPPSRYYNKGGDTAWVNGHLGNDDRFNDDDWLGWNGSNFDGTIHFASTTQTSTLHTRFFHEPASGVWVPKIVTVQISDNGVDFKTVAEKKMDVPANAGAAPFTLSWPEADTKYLRIIASPYGAIPSGSPDAGDDAWLFVDEMIVE